MIVGVEILGERLDDYARTKLLAVRPALVKCRHPAVAGEVLGLLPEARILARSPGEGFERGDIVDGYGRWLSTLTRYADRFLAHEFANEPNDHSIDPEWWASMAIGWLSTIDPPVDLCTPGLIRYNRRQDWERAIARIPQRHPNGRLIYRGKHIYWQQDGWQAAIDDVLGDGLDPADVLITEINTGHARAEYHPSVTERAEECRQAIAQLARLGYPAASIFALTPWQDWGFSYDVSDLARILAAGAVARPVPAVKTRRRRRAMPEFRFGFADYAESHPEVGDPVMDEMQIAPGVAFQMTSTGVLWFAQEAADNGHPPIRFSRDPNLR